MKKIFLTLLSFSLLTISVTAAPKPASACSCIAGGTVEEAYAEAAAIFAGTVRSVTAKTGTGYTVDMTVDEYWKGDLDSEVTISTAGDSAMCGYNFSVGEHYLVYAYGEGTLNVGLCSRTSELSYPSAQEDIVALNAITPSMHAPTDLSPETPATQNSVNPWLWKGAALGLAVLLGYLLGRRNR